MSAIPLKRKNLTVCAADITVRKIQWLWKGYLPLGKLVMIAGVGGLGKSTLTADFAARVSSGAPWPGSKRSRTPGGVLMICAEDDPETTIIPRLQVAGADLSRVRFMDDPFFNLRSVPKLEQSLKEDPSCRLVVVDPISAYMGNTDSHNNADVRGVLKPVQDILQRHRVTMVCVTHFNKGSGSGTQRFSGSGAFTDAARAAWSFERDPDEEDKDARLFWCRKANLGPDGYAIKLKVRHEPENFIEWGEVKEAPDDGLMDYEAIDAVVRKTKLDEAMEWLVFALKDGPVWTKTLQLKATEAGHSERTLRRAKELLGVTSKPGMGKKGESVDVKWYWDLPDP